MPSARLYNYQKASEEFATKTFIDEKEKAAFEAGIKWTVENLLYETNDGHPMLNASELAQYKNLTLLKIKKFCKQMLLPL